MATKPVPILMLTARDSNRHRLALPAATASAGPLKEAVERAGRELAAKQQQEVPRSRARLWTGIGLIAGGSVLGALGAIEIGDDEPGSDHGEDLDCSDDREDADGGNKALIGGDIAAAVTGGLLLLTGRQAQGPRASVQAGRISVKHTVRF